MLFFCHNVHARVVCTSSAERIDGLYHSVVFTPGDETYLSARLSTMTFVICVCVCRSDNQTERTTFVFLFALHFVVMCRRSTQLWWCLSSTNFCSAQNYNHKSSNVLEEHYLLYGVPLPTTTSFTHPTFLRGSNMFAAIAQNIYHYHADAHWRECVGLCDCVCVFAVVGDCV